MYIYSFTHDNIQSQEEAERFLKAVKDTIPSYLFKVPYQTEVDFSGGICIIEYCLSDMDINHVTLKAVESAYPDVEINLYDDTRLLDVYPLEDRPYFYEHFLSLERVSTN